MSVSTAARLRAPLLLATDGQIARLAARGEARAFAAIYERYHQELYRYCHSILGNGEDARDALQNTMARVLRALPGEEREIALRPWLYRIAHNESITLLRERRPHADLDAAGQLESPGVEQQTAIRTQLRQLTADLGQLGDRQRSALVMRELSGLGYPEIAAALGTTEAAAKQTVYEARVALQALAEGREMDCAAVQRSISDGDRRLLRARRVRSHLRSCSDCRAFSDAIAARRSQFAALAPPLSAVGAASLFQGLVGGGAQAATGAGGAGGLVAGLLGGGAAKVAAGSAAKVALVGAITVGAGVEVATSTDLLGGGQEQRPVQAAPAPGPATAPVIAPTPSTVEAGATAGPSLDGGGLGEPGGAAAVRGGAAGSADLAGDPPGKALGHKRDPAVDGLGRGTSDEAEHPSRPTRPSAGGTGDKAEHPSPPTQSAGGSGHRGDSVPAPGTKENGIGGASLREGGSAAVAGHLQAASASPGRVEKREPPPRRVKELQ